jgi:hypothetical protein
MSPTRVLLCAAAAAFGLGCTGAGSSADVGDAGSGDASQPSCPHVRGQRVLIAHFDSTISSAQSPTPASDRLYVALTTKAGWNIGVTAATQGPMTRALSTEVTLPTSLLDISWSSGRLWWREMTTGSYCCDVHGGPVQTTTFIARWRDDASGAMGAVSSPGTLVGATAAGALFQGAYAPDSLFLVGLDDRMRRMGTHTPTAPALVRDDRAFYVAAPAIYEVDLTTGAERTIATTAVEVPTFPQPTASGPMLALDDANLYVYDPVTTRVVAVARADGAPRGSFPVALTGVFRGMAALGDSLYIADQAAVAGTRGLLRMSKADGTTTRPVDAAPLSIGGDACAVYFTDGVGVSYFAP